jgi:hypothetical protein
MRARGSDATTETAIRVALSKGDAGMHKIAARLGVGTGMVQQIGDRSRLWSIAGRTGATGAGAAGWLRSMCESVPVAHSFHSPTSFRSRLTVRPLVPLRDTLQEPFDVLFGGQGFPPARQS